MNRKLLIALTTLPALMAGSAFAQHHGGGDWHHGGGWHDGGDWHGGHTDVGLGFNFIIPPGGYYYDDGYYQPGPVYAAPAVAPHPPGEHIYYYYPASRAYYAPWRHGWYYRRHGEWWFADVPPYPVAGTSVRLSLYGSSPVASDAWVRTRFGG